MKAQKTFATTAMSDAEWVAESPSRYNILVGLEDVSFLTPGRDFKTLVAAVGIITKTDTMYLDTGSMQANLAAMKKRKLVKKTRKPTGAVVYTRQHGPVKVTKTYWRLTNEGITVLWSIRNGEVPYGGSGGAVQEGEGRPVAVPAGDAGSPELAREPGETDQRGHADDAGRPGAGEPEEDRDRYDFSYRRPRYVNY